MPVITQRPVQLFLYLIFLTHPCIKQGAQLQTIFLYYLNNEVYFLQRDNLYTFLRMTYVPEAGRQARKEGNEEDRPTEPQMLEFGLYW